MPFLARPRPAAEHGPGARVTLDPGQSAVVDAVLAGRDPALLVLGAPGTGKTTVALEAVVAAARAEGGTSEGLVLRAPAA